MSSNQANYERSRIINLELGPREPRSIEQADGQPRTSPAFETPRSPSGFYQLLLKYGKSSTVRWILVLIVLFSAFGISFGAGGYTAWKQGFCEHNLLAVMNNTLTVGHLVVSGGGRLAMNAGLAWALGWLLVGCFFEVYMY